MQPTGVTVPIYPPNPGGTDKTTPEKEKLTKGTPISQSMALRPTENTVPSESLFTTRTVKLNEACPIPGYPYGRSDHKPALLESCNKLQMRQIKPEEMESQVCSNGALRRQWNHLDNSSGQALINLINQGDTEKAKEYITNNPLSLAARDEEGNTALHLAALHGSAIKNDNDEILQCLLEQPLIINRLTKMEYASEFVTNENGTCAKLIRDAREKVKLPFCPVQNFDKTLFQQTWQREKDKVVSKKSILPQVKALLSGLQKIGVYVRCNIQENTDEKGQFWEMGDATASVGLIKTLVALGVKTIHVQLSPPDDSDLATRQKFNREEQVRYIKKQRVALSKLAYLLPGIKLKPGIQEIYIEDTKVIISSCNFRRENKINAAVTLSFLSPRRMYQHLGFAQESYINLTPYRFNSKFDTMYLDTRTSVTAMPDCNIIPLHLPANAIIPDDDRQPQAAERSTESVNSHTATLISAINQLCDLSDNGKIQTAVVYGLHHYALRKSKKTILTNWLSAIKTTLDQVTDAPPVVVTTTVSAFRDEDRKNGKRSLYEIARTTGFTLIDFRNPKDRASLMAAGMAEGMTGEITAGEGQRFLCLMPSLPRQSFNKLVQCSWFPVLCEGANLTTTLLQNGQPHLSLLPNGTTPVAQDMGGPLEALKALAFSYKLRMEKSGVDIEALKILSNLVRESRYTEALSFINRIKTLDFESGAMDFVWADPQPSPLKLRSVTIMSLLQKGKKLGSIEKKALLCALNPSDIAWANYINSCMDNDSITTQHFRLQQMHVNKSFNNKVAAALLQFGRHKKLLT
ncbi:ankyrin repeat domain-containing protein [Endozoicomonas sp. SESOKO1]|uniref:ankyrin repeat domain-containing protein n=1 Tax=Endozoicomonas sp. SESOKO1 TaxID=2828742 RepID=UPI00214759CB|nr:ankyrin repeat domain-containing protein [Endozoicomonas sp. SESOKO1]